MANEFEAAYTAMRDAIDRAYDEADTREDEERMAAVLRRMLKLIDAVNHV